MADMNLCVFAGHLVRDPSRKATAAGMTVCEFRIAVNRRTGGEQDDTLWLDVVTFGKRAEVCSRYLAKGQGVLISGMLKQERWQDRNGNSRQSFCLMADNVQFLGNQSAQSGAPAPAAVQTMPVPPPAPAPAQEELPF